MAISGITDQSMIDELTNHRISLGREAQQIHPLINRFFDEYRGAMIKRWEASRSTEEREEIHRQLGSLKALKLQIGAYITDGKLAEQEQEEINGRQ